MPLPRCVVRYPGLGEVRATAVCSPRSVSPLRGEQVRQVLAWLANTTANVTELSLAWHTHWRMCGHSERQSDRTWSVRAGQWRSLRTEVGHGATSTPYVKLADSHRSPFSTSPMEISLEVRDASGAASARYHSRVRSAAQDADWDDSAILEVRGESPRGDGGLVA